MRSLVVTRWTPWPPTSGARHRSANMIGALAELGPVDVFLLPGPEFEDGGDPPDGVTVLGTTTRNPRNVRPSDRARSALPWARPATVRRLDPAPERASFVELVRGTYDLAWFVRIESWLSLGDLVDAPAVIDYDDLRDQLLRSRSRSTWSGPPAKTRLAHLRRWLEVADAAAWGRLQRRVAGDVRAVTVCSELDRRRLGVANGAVVGNGVDLPTQPVGRTEIGAIPTLCFHGSLNYGPNTDAAELLVRDVLPRLRARVPDACVRLVGRHDARVAALADAPGVVLTDLVPDITTELARADVVAVPLREGAGTRIKVLEALAHRVPVVATSLAVEGLEVETGRHLLVADDPDAFAAACASLLEDLDLRRRLADAGEALVRDRHQWRHARDAVAAIATAAAGPTA